MSKDKKTKFFRVAVEGQTTDGRIITREWIEQMAATYSPTKYGARVNLEHFRGLMPDGPFKAYGDVLAAESHELDGEFKGKLGLFAQISPTDDLIAMNKKRQKVYTSIELDHDFAGTGQAYLVGLAVTDSPASLGTEILTFAAQNPTASPFAHKKQKPTNVFSSALFELELELEESTDPGPSLFSKVTSLLNFAKKKDATDEARFSDVTQAVEALATHGKEQADTVGKHAGKITDLEGKFTDLEGKFTALTQQLGNTDGGGKPRPPATGGNGAIATDC